MITCLLCGKRFDNGKEAIEHTAEKHATEKKPPTNKQMQYVYGSNRRFTWAYEEASNLSPYLY